MASKDGPSIKIEKLELGGRKNPFIGELVGSEVNFRPPNNPSGNTPEPQKPCAQPCASVMSVEINEFHNTGTENPVIGRVEDSTLNLYDKPIGPNTPGRDTAPKVEKDQEEQSRTERRDEENAGGGEGRGGKALIGGGQPPRQMPSSGGPKINIGHIKIGGERNPIIVHAKGSTFNL